MIAVFVFSVETSASIIFTLEILEVVWMHAGGIFLELTQLNNYQIFLLFFKKN